MADSRSRTLRSKLCEKRYLTKSCFGLNGTYALVRDEASLSAGEVPFPSSEIFQRAVLLLSEIDLCRPLRFNGRDVRVEVAEHVLQFIGSL